MTSVVKRSESLRQRGSAMILSILVMMGLGLIVLNSLQQQLSAGLSLTSNQHRYNVAWENAASALAWGIGQSWSDAMIPTGSAGRWRMGSLFQEVAGPVSALPFGKISFWCVVKAG
ncbi:DUF2509 family protein [Rahnella perminowiae]|uniref:DUF2509 family protein n=1 Tax=Rahnella perminowiae TaxID=2816244 RepID=UPI0030842E37